MVNLGKGYKGFFYYSFNFKFEIISKCKVKRKTVSTYYKQATMLTYHLIKRCICLKPIFAYTRKIFASAFAPTTP